MGGRAGAGVCGRVLQLPVARCVVAALVLLTLIQFFTSNGSYNYDAIPLSSLDKELYKKVNPKLEIKNSNHICEYKHIIESETTIHPWNIPTKWDDFLPVKIVNGSYTPTACTPQFSVAIIIPYRNRQKQLDVLLPYLHNFLRKQSIHYKIYLIEQQDEKPFNKGMLFNIAAKYAISEKFPCLILHDVDMLPLNDANLYACTQQPRHMSASVDKMRYVLPYPDLVGGALAIRADQYTLVNGFSNSFLKWGGEDDDFSERLKAKNLKIIRLPRRMSEYTMLSHSPAPMNEDVWSVLRQSQRERELNLGRSRDGLDTIAYDYLHVKPHRLFTFIGVKL